MNIKTDFLLHSSRPVLLLLCAILCDGCDYGRNGNDEKLAGYDCNVFETENAEKKAMKAAIAKKDYDAAMYSYGALLDIYNKYPTEGKAISCEIDGVANTYYFSQPFKSQNLATLAEWNKEIEAIKEKPQKAEPKAKLPNFSSEFFAALKDNKAEAIPALVAEGFDPNEGIRLDDYRGFEIIPPVHCMVSKKCKYDSAMLKALVENGADLEKKIFGDLSSGMVSPLMLAVWNKNPQALSDLLALGADPNATFSNGDTSLHEAVIYARGQAFNNRDLLYALQMIQALLANTKTDRVKKNNEGHTPLYFVYNHQFKMKPEAEKEYLSRMKPVIDLFEKYGVKE